MQEKRRDFLVKWLKIRLGLRSGTVGYFSATINSKGKPFAPTSYNKLSI